MEVTFVPVACDKKPLPKPLTEEEFSALRKLPIEKVSQRDFDRIFATFDYLERSIDFLKNKVKRHRKALRAVAAVARDGLCFGDGFDFPMQTGIVWDDSDEYL